MRGFIGIASRNVFRNGKRSFTLGLNYAVVSFILVLLFSFSRGAARNIEASLETSSAGLVTVTGQFAEGGRIYAGLRRAAEVAELAREVLGPGTRVLTRYQLQSAVYFRGASKRVSFSGVFPAEEEGLRGQIAFRSGSWELWAADPNGLALPADLAEYFGLSLGDEVVVSTRTRFGAFNTGILRVRGVWETDNFFLRGRALVAFPFLRGLDLAPEDGASALYLSFPGREPLGAARDRLSRALAARGFEVSSPATDSEAIAVVSSASTKYEADAEGRDRAMLKLATLDEVLGIVRSVLSAVNAVGALVAAVMLLVVAVSVFINLRMSVNERLREIGTMRALGYQAAAVSALLVAESVGLALVFSGAGAILGAGAALAARALLSFPPGGQLGIFLESGRPALLPLPLDMAAVVAALSLLAALFAFLPARRGGRIRPVEALGATF